MIVYKYHYLIFLYSLLFFACNGNASHRSSNNDKTSQDSIESKQDTIVDTALSFHKWYLSATNSSDTTIHFAPNIVEGKDGMCNVDYKPYFDQLKSLGTVSEKFLEAEKKRMSQCEKYLNTIHYQTYINADGYAFDANCIDLYYYVWFKSQESPFDIIAIKKIINDDNTAYVDAAFTYSEKDIPTIASVRIFLEKDSNDKWQIVKISFFDDKGNIEPDVATSNNDSIIISSDSIFGAWENSNSIELDIYQEGMNILYHGQCAYFYNTEVVNDKEVILIWDYNMDCKFDNRVKETFGIQNHPQVGKPFAKYILEAENIIYVDYYYKEWVERYNEDVNEVFSQTFQRKFD